VLGQVDRVAVAGDLGEAHHVGGGDGLRQGLRQADLEILEIEHAQFGQHDAADLRFRPVMRLVLPAPATASHDRGAESTRTKA